MSLELFIDIVLPAAVWNQKYFLEVKGAGA